MTPIFPRLLVLVAPFWRWMLLSILLGALTIGSSIALMASSAYIIARAALAPSIAELQVAIVGVRFFGISRGVARYLERLVSHETTFRLLARLRVWFYSALEPLAPARLMGYRSGDLLARIVSDIETLEHFYLRVIAPPAVALSVALGVALFMAFFDPVFALAILLFLGLAGIVAPLLTHVLSRRVGRAMVATRSELDVVALDGIQGIAELLAFGRGEAHLAQVAEQNHRLARQSRRMGWITGMNGALHAVLLGGAVVAMLWLGVPLVREGGIDGIDLTILALVTMSCFEAVQGMPLALQFLSQSLAAGARLFEIADAPPSIDTSASARDAPPARHDITFEDVRFRYGPDEAPALDGLSFTVAQGERVAVVGPSGAGKTTLINLLLRFWDVEGGVVRVGGVDIRDFAPEALRGMIGVVTQRTHLFNTTVRENILIGRRDASDAEVMAAAQRAQIHDFIMGLPDGYDTFVGEQGFQLSGGERQRIAIARALLKDAPVLVLDEATANLDSVTEQAVRAAIRALMMGRTTLVITHRLTGITDVDRVIVLREGRIVEQGVPEDLLRDDSLYRRMWDYQRSVIAAEQ